MRHLDRDALVALAEGGKADASDAAHAQACERCGNEVASLAAVLAELRREEMPEPSPLFWRHLSARISSAVAREAREPSGRSAVDRPGWRWWVSALSLGAAVLALLVAVGSPPAPSFGARAGTERFGGVGENDGTPADAWQVVVDVAASVDIATAGDELPELAPATGDGAVLDLTPEERAALVQLLHQEIADAAL